MIDDRPIVFESIAAELRALGITLAWLPGEYRVNYRNGSDATARLAETLNEVLDLGREMAAAAPSLRTAVRRSRRRGPRNMIRAHNHRWWGRALKKQREEGQSRD
jgi:hypothetical protein